VPDKLVACKRLLDDEAGTTLTLQDSAYSPIGRTRRHSVRLSHAAAGLARVDSSQVP